MIIRFSERHVIMDVRKIVLRPGVGVYFYGIDGTGEKISELDINHLSKPVSIPGVTDSFSKHNKAADLYAAIEMLMCRNEGKSISLPF